MLIIAVILFIFGLMFGSFISALTWRIHGKKDWVKDRSRCPHCGHTLAVFDLIPLLSWLFLRGCCRYCEKPISWQYPAIEIATGTVFAGLYYFWPVSLESSGQIVLLITCLVTSVGLMALLVYDARWLLLPSKILYPTAAAAIAGRLIYIVGFEEAKLKGLASWALSVAVAGGFFWLLFEISKGRWIGFGDVRLGLITGTLLGAPDKSLLMIFLASVAGTLFILPSLLTKRKKFTSQIPYGPFLIIGTYLSIFFASDLIDWYHDLILP